MPLLWALAGGAFLGGLIHDRFEKNSPAPTSSLNINTIAFTVTVASIAIIAAAKAYKTVSK